MSTDPHCHPLRRSLRVLPVAGVALLIAGTGSDAAAQDLGVSVDEVEPAPTDTDGALNVYSADTLDQGQFELGVIAAYSEDPTVITDEVANDDLAVAVEDRMTMNFVGGVGITDWLEFGMAVPLELYEATNTIDPQTGQVVEDENANLGDIRLVPAAELLDTTSATDPTGVRLSLLADTRLPTATETDIGPSGFQLEPIVAFDADTSASTRISVNAGYLYRAEDEVRGFDMSDAVTYGASAFVALSSRVALTPELSGQIDVDDGQGPDLEDVPLEGLMGVALSPADDWIVSARAGAAFTESFDRPDFRSTIGVSYAFGHEGMDRDEDHDGVIASADQCLDAPEDIDGWQDDDGCPDLDNDADRIADVYDRCPLTAEDIDGHVDIDGCPDVDNDNDGIADANDFCAMVAEDFDTDADSDGCPDTTQSIVEVSCSTVTVDEEIHFATDSAELTARSQEVLDDVAIALSEVELIERVHIQGYADQRGSEAYNYELSQLRAEAVRDHLVAWGIDAERLVVVGAGEQARLASGGTPAAMSENRRVAFFVEEPPIVCIETESVELRTASPTYTSQR